MVLVVWSRRRVPPLRGALGVISSDDLGRTLKLELDESRAATTEEAQRLAATYRIGVRLGEGFWTNRAATAAALTTINCAVRAFRGGVFVAADDDAVIAYGWGLGKRLSAVVAGYGATMVDHLPDDLPFVVSINEPRSTDQTSKGPTILYATWDGWAGGVVAEPGHRRNEDDGQPLAGVLAGALAVSEAFQSIRGFAIAGRRPVGLSLWRPDLSWLDPLGHGPALDVLPEKIWLLGLGHLGQAYAWSLGWLPYPSRALMVGLVDPQYIVKANVDTGLLAALEHVEKRKTRIVADRLEALGMRTLLVERSFDANFRRGPSEPALAFAGFDSPEPRRHLEAAGFMRIVDAGLGGGPQYLEMLLHAFPSELRSATAFPQAERSDAEALLDRPAYVAEIARREADGLTNEAARCGVVEIAGRTVGAAFVGAAASALVLAEELRALHDGSRFEVVSWSLRSPEHIQTVVNPAPGPDTNPGYVTVT